MTRKVLLLIAAASVLCAEAAAGSWRFDDDRSAGKKPATSGKTGWAFDDVHGVRPPGFAAARARAVEEDKPLVIFVGVKARKVPGGVVVSVSQFEYATIPSVVVGWPHGGTLRRVDLPDDATGAVIMASRDKAVPPPPPPPRVVAPPAYQPPPAYQQYQQYQQYQPPPETYQQYQPAPAYQQYQQYQPPAYQMPAQGYSSAVRTAAPAAQGRSC